VTPSAVVLAAGNGARLVGSLDAPKPLVPVGGRPLLDHVVVALVRAGVERVCVVTGHRGEEVRAHAYRVTPRRGIVYVHNPRHEEPNGLSLLAAEPEIGGPFLLLMSDHLFAAEAVPTLLARECPTEGGLLAIDRRPGEVFDPADATRVATRGDTILAVGKRLAVHDAVDSGLFLLSPAAFSAMRESVAAGDASLSGGVSVLARRGAMKAVDVRWRWIDVDTRAALVEAERLVALGLVGCALREGATCSPATRP
jgi:1L-myo-inositol 1-phosphate cytidylyltransferase